VRETKAETGSATRRLRTKDPTVVIVDVTKNYVCLHRDSVSYMAALICMMHALALHKQKQELRSTCQFLLHHLSFSITHSSMLFLPSTQTLSMFFYLFS